MNSYIVKFKKASSDDLVDSHNAKISELTESITKKGGEIKHVYSSRTFQGFAGKFSEETLKELEALKGDGGIEFIEPDSEVGIAATGV